MNDEAVLIQSAKAAPAADGQTWVMAREGRRLGYATAVPVPGLPGLLALDGFVDPAWRRRGLGGRLLAHVLAALRQTHVRQVAHPVASLDSPAARFLLKHGFFVEHEEWRMRLDDLGHLPPPTRPPGRQWRSYPRPPAIRYFRQLYDECFSGRPWYQPYTSDEEVAADLERADDLLFLTHPHPNPLPLREREQAPLALPGRGAGGEGRPSSPSQGEGLGVRVGFVWTRRLDAHTGEIEPLGVRPAYQRQGYGRALLLAGLRQLAKRGAERAQLGVWVANTAAIHLYQSVGFQHTQTITYLAYDF